MPAAETAEGTESPEVLARYERAFAEWLGVRHAFAFWKGRVALYAALRALEVGAGDEVVMPGYTCVMNVNPVAYVGARSIYADIDPQTYNTTPAAIEGAIGPRTKAIIAQHTYGFPAAMDAVLEIGRRHGVPVLEDCCLALGSRWKGQRCGTMGRAAYFSFQWNKPYTCGLGGMLVTNDDELAERVRALCVRERIRPAWRESAMLTAQYVVYRTFIYPRTTAMAQMVFRWLTRRGLVVGSSSTCEYEPKMEADFFKGMGARQARSGLARLRRLDEAIKHRRQLAKLYDELLAEHGWTPPLQPDGAEPVLVRYPVRVKDKQRALTEAARHFVELGSWFECPLHPIETPLQAYGYQPGQCPEAERASREVVNLPLHPRASERTVRRTVEFIRQIGPAT